MSRVICLQSPTVFWLGAGSTSLSFFNVNEVSKVRQTEINTTEPLVNEPSAFEFRMVIEN